MRRLAGVLLLAALQAPAAFRAISAASGGTACCAMACHDGEAMAGGVCCLVGARADGRPVVRSCASGSESVIPVLGFQPAVLSSVGRLGPPRDGGAADPAPGGGHAFILLAPPDPVPLSLS